MKTAATRDAVHTKKTLRMWRDAMTAMKAFGMAVSLTLIAIALTPPARSYLSTFLF
jgi:hypothetical protein